MSTNPGFMNDARSLRVAAIWGETVLGSAVLNPGEVFDWQSTIGVSPPELEAQGQIPTEPVRSMGGNWELDPRGAVAGYLRMRGREEDVGAFARAGAPVALLPGDVALFQYGAFAFFAQPVSPAPLLPSGFRPEPWVVIAAFLSGIGHVGLLYSIFKFSTPIPVPEPLELLSERRLREELGVKALDEEEKEKPTSGDKSGGSGVPDPGIKDKKDQGGGKKMAGAEGKTGKTDGKGETHLPGQVPGVPIGSITDVIGSGAGQQLTDTLASMQNIATVAGGLNAKDLNWGSGSGFGLKGGGGGGGGTGPGGVPYGAWRVLHRRRAGDRRRRRQGWWWPRRQGRRWSWRRGAGGEKKISVVSAGGGGSKGFSADEIRRVVMSHMGQIRACYESALDASPGLKGSVTVSWHITGGGTVSRSSVASSTLGNGRVEGCITRVVKGWTFKNPDAVEADASWGFQFTPP